MNARGPVPGWSLAMLLPAFAATGLLTQNLMLGVAPANHVVEISGTAYHPALLEVQKGDTVTWINRDVIPHTATSTTSQGPVLDTGTLTMGQSGRFVANRTGEVRYTCSFHPTMQGRLTVRAAGTSGAQ